MLCYVLNVNLRENMRVLSHENSIKVSDKCSSTITTKEANTLSNSDTGRKINARASYADAVRTPSCEEIVREKLNVDLSTPESHVLNKLSGRRSTTLESQPLIKLSGRRSKRPEGQSICEPSGRRSPITEGQALSKPSG